VESSIALGLAQEALNIGVAEPKGLWGNDNAFKHTAVSHPVDRTEVHLKNFGHVARTQ
jgi:hypothetical protein